MGLNIKNQRVHDLARTVARRTGASQTAAIEVALERYLADLGAEESAERERGRTETARIIDDMRQRLRAAGAPALSTDDLYDDQGLPR